MDQRRKFYGCSTVTTTKLQQLNYNNILNYMNLSLCNWRRRRARHRSGTRAGTGTIWTEARTRWRGYNSQGGAQRSLWCSGTVTSSIFLWLTRIRLGQINQKRHTVCPRSSDPFYIVIYYMKWVTTSWTYSSMLYVQTNLVNQA